MPITPPPMTMALLPVRSVETPCLLMTPSGSAIGRGELLRACRLLLMVGGLADAEGVGEGSQEVASYVSCASGWRILPSRWPWLASDSSEGRRVGQEGGSPCRFWRWAYHIKKKN